MACTNTTILLESNVAACRAETRRRFIAVSIFALTGSLLAPPAYGRTDCNGYGWCETGVNYNRMARSYHPQTKPLWCWAASIQMIFSFYGYDVPQDDIVSSVYGAPYDLPATQTYQLTSSLSRTWTDRNDASFTVSIQGLYDFQNGIVDLTNQDIITALENDQPLLMGNLSHAMVLAAVGYSGGSAGADINNFRVIDPWPGIGVRGPQSISELHPRHLGGSLMYLASPYIF